MKRHTIVDNFLDYNHIQWIFRQSPSARIVTRYDHSVLYIETPYERFISAKRWNMTDRDLALFMQENGDQYSYVSPASFGYSLYRKRFAPQGFVLQSGDFRSTFSRSALYGGRCEVYKHGIGNYNQYDINSSYPYHATQTKFPRPHSMVYVKDTSDQMYKNIFDYEGVSEVVFSQDQHIPPLPIRKDGRIYYACVSNAKGRYTHNELRYGLQRGVTIHKVNKQFIGETLTDNPFTPFVEHCYNKRIDTGKKIWKMIANGLFGRMAVTGGGLLEFRISTDRDLFKQTPRSMKHYFGACCLARELSAPPSSNPMWAASVLSESRIKLHSLITQYDAVYTDTDCVVTTDEYPLPVSDRLGDYKHKVGEYDIKGAKCYRVGTELKMSGVNSRFRTMSDFYAAVGTSERVRLPDGTTKPHQFSFE